MASMEKKGTAVDSNINSRSDDLPLDLITEILSRLPAKSVLRFKSVSWPWYRLINQLIKQQEFINLHLKRSLETNPDNYLVEIMQEEQRLHSFTSTPNQESNYHLEVTEYSHPWNLFDKDQFHTHLGSSCHGLGPTTQVVGSCNGLLCFFTACSNKRVLFHSFDPCSNSNAGFFLYNPVTRDLRKLPHLDPIKNMLYMVFGFGYDCVSDDYKVLAYDSEEHTSMLYSLKSDAWENTLNVPTNPFSSDGDPTVLANNSFYWMHWSLPYGKWIVCFDLSTRRYYEILHPVKDTSVLTILRGQLCIVTLTLDIWLLNKHDDDDDDKQNSTWTRIFRHQSAGQLNNLDFNGDLGFGRVCCFKDGHNIILALIIACNLQNILVCCDLETNEAREIEIEATNLDHLKSIFNIHAWGESLVSLLTDKSKLVYDIHPWVESFVPLH